MRYHATVHNDNNDTVIECHVFADDTGHAREKIKAHLRVNGLQEQAKMNIALVETREDIATDFLVIK